jgi:hypothetical protein
MITTEARRHGEKFFWRNQNQKASQTENTEKGRRSRETTKLAAEFRRWAQIELVRSGDPVIGKAKRKEVLAFVLDRRYCEVR